MIRRKSKVSQIFDALNIHTDVSVKFFIYSIGLKLDRIKVKRVGRSTKCGREYAFATSVWSTCYTVWEKLVIR